MLGQMHAKQHFFHLVAQQAPIDVTRHRRVVHGKLAQSQLHSVTRADSHANGENFLLFLLRLSSSLSGHTSSCVRLLSGPSDPVSVDVENKSNVQLHLVKVFLRKVVTYRANTPTTVTKKSKDVILTVQEGPAPAGSTKHWDMKFEIPPIPPSNLVNCSIIDLDYDLKVECVVSGMHMNLKDRKYVTIGTVPLVGMAGQAAPSAPPPAQYSPTQPAVLPLGPGEQVLPNGPPAPGADGVPGGWVMPGTAPANPPYQSLYPTLSVPVYKESAYTARTIQDRGDSNYTKITGPTNFAPYYPTYAAVQPPPLPQ
ncbi:hypothetical protein MSG28_012336 [Choristoneura fumiferana]|uniref:Uncharacterized protein n=1 Tax=Choristoneura fumiferana TaxID=7141 RepID=A0ACC0KCH9_CHOFU|nr:hypothetical protein MSG28_012336 [Choristoneura fumiferana]